MKVINLGGGWCLSADAHNYILGRERKNPAKGNLIKQEFFFPTLTAALEHFVWMQEAAQIAAYDGEEAREIISVVNRVHEETRAQIHACAHEFKELT